MIQILHSYRFTCDWAHGCLAAFTPIGAQTLADAKARARREGWTFTRRKSDGKEFARCLYHAFENERPVGRPKAS